MEKMIGTPLDLPDFKASIGEVVETLKAIGRVIPKRVDEKLIAYLELVQDDPVGLELLRNAISPKTS